VWRANISMRDVPSEAAVSPVIVECRVEGMHEATLLRLNKKGGRWDGRPAWGGMIDCILVTASCTCCFCAYCTYDVAMLSICMS